MEKFCKNCEHSRRDWLWGWEFATCEAPQNKESDLVTGREAYKFGKFCEVRRMNDCGADGNWFEQKRQPIWMRVLGLAKKP